MSVWIVVIVGMFIIALLYGAETPPPLWVMAVIGAPAMSLLWCGFFLNLVRANGREHWYYALTDQRLIVVSRLFGVKTHYSAFIDNIETVNKSMRRDGLTTLTFHVPRVTIDGSLPRMLRGIFSMPYLSDSIIFHHLPKSEAQDIYAAFDELRTHTGYRGEYDYKSKARSLRKSI